MRKWMTKLSPLRWLERWSEQMLGNYNDVVEVAAGRKRLEMIEDLNAK